MNFNSSDGFKDQFVEFKQLQSAVEECDVVHLGQCVQTISHGCRSFRLQDDSRTSRFAYTIMLLERGIQLFRETLSEKSTKLHKPTPKGSMGRRIELLHVLNTNEIYLYLYCNF